MLFIDSKLKESYLNFIKDPEVVDKKGKFNMGDRSQTGKQNELYSVVCLERLSYELLIRGDAP